MNEFSGANVPIKEVAKIMNKSEQFIRLSLVKGVLPIGYAIRNDDSRNYNYYVSPKLLYEYTGIKYHEQ